MDPQSQVLLRNIGLFSDYTLLAGLPYDQLLSQLPSAKAWSWHAGIYNKLQSHFPSRCSFGTAPPETPIDSAVLFLPKSKELAMYLLHNLAIHLEGKALFLVGEKRGGIESAAKLLMPFGIPKKIDSARHCQLWQVTIKNTPQKPLTLTDVTQYYTLPYNNDSITIATLPGVFSYGRLDKGSALLLNNLTGLPSGHLLDFGCGAGVIGSVLKKHYPSSHITLLDVDAFAVASSHLTLEANELTADVICGDGITSAPAHLNAIITNPPFHQGIHTDYRATEQLLRDASNHLKRQGELRLVANNFLKYAPLIENQIGPCSVLEQKQGFKVYQSILSR